MQKFILSIIITVFISTVSYGQSTKLDEKLGKSNFEKVVATYEINDNSAMNEYLNKVGQKLVSNLDSALFKYKFTILNDPIPNAFALPAGYIFITSGLIPILKTEDELACIIGHEIIHSNNRHSVRQLKKRILPTVLTLPITFGAAFIPGGKVLTAPLTVSQSLLFASYSRKFENEADEQGVLLALKAGYNPLALPNALNRLMKTMEHTSGQKETKNYFADHPYTPTRDKNINETVKDLNVKKSEQITKDFSSEFNGIIYGNTPSKGLIRDNVYLHPENNIYAEFPNTWKVINNDSIVSAYNKTKDAAISISMKSSKLEPSKASDNYIKQLSKKQKKLLVNSSTVKVNNKDAYIINFENVSFKDTTYAYVMWMNVGAELLELSGMSDFKTDDSLVSIINSIRPLTEQEKKSIMVKYVSVVKANNNENISDLSKRTKNLIKPDLTAIINGYKPNDKLKEGEEIKIVLEKKYFK